VGTPGSVIAGVGGIITPLLTVVIFSYYLQTRIEKEQYHDARYEQLLRCLS